jgi:hypothetical protein
VGNSFEDHDARNPSVIKVPGVEGQPQERYEGVVTTRQNHQGNQIGCGKSPRPISQQRSKRSIPFAERDMQDTERDIHGNQPGQTECLESTRKSAHTDGARELKLPLVTVAEQRRVDDILLEPGYAEIVPNKVSLSLTTQTVETTKVSGHESDSPPDEVQDNRTSHGNQGEVSVVHLQDIVYVSVGSSA